MSTTTLQREAAADYAWFVRIFRRIHADQVRFLEQYRITPPQLGIMAMLLREDGMTFKELSQRTALHSSTLTGIMDRLEISRFARRVMNREDRRQFHLHLTDKGREMLAHVNTMDPAGLLCRALAALDEDERSTLTTLLAKLVTAMGDENYADLVTTLMEYQNTHQDDANR